MTAATTVLLSEAEIAACVARVAETLAPRLQPDCVGICLLTGGLWFTADLTRALARLGVDLSFDALWLSSYGDGRESGELLLRADLQRPVQGKQVLLMDDVLDTGASLKFARDHVLRAGASEVIIAVMAQKPVARSIEADVVGWEAPLRYLVGYGLDDGAKMRGLPYIGALD
ncbi:phosphoribosyltransferase [Asticcacaulis endophyticus]|uniref:Hypoxanthine phosphoribosyltransferase n=1 Tax=Asticcacaulis endophyticus TaxID=1395890 RepID=A0A918Q779_9CAUL|nr:phosphoribosyltransferase family protein [Asticcacaulis endophyticus]GGZ34547.1 hypoxanthine phosphoribosyltransferase [Asticcacaulis endophyticus]